MSAQHSFRTATIDGLPLAKHLGLWAVALALGSVTAVGVWLFNKAIDAVGSIVRDVLVPALGPLGAWSIVPILALAGLLVAGIVRFMKPEKLAAMGHIIDGVAEHEGRLDQRNAAVTVAGSAVGLGMGMPVGADTPSAMIGGHLGSWVALRLGWPTVFVQALIVAGVSAGISATFLAQLSAAFFGLEVVLGGIGGLVFIVPILLAVAASAVTTFRLTGTPPVYAIPPDAVHWDVSLLLYLLPAVVTAIAAIAYVRLFPLLKGAWAAIKLPAFAQDGHRGRHRRGRRGRAARRHRFRHRDDEGAVRGCHDPAGDPAGPGAGQARADAGQPRSRFRRRRHRTGHAHRLDARRGRGHDRDPDVPRPGLSPVIFAMVGTTAMLSGSFHAPLFAALIVFEMAGAYEMLVPLMLAAAIGLGVATPFQTGSVYTFAFGKLGIDLRPGRFRATPPAPPDPAGS